MDRVADNENGTAIVAALLILLLLTFIAITATDTTVNEKAMIRSESIFDQTFSLAESAALEGLQKLASVDNDKVDDLLPKRLSGTSVNKNLLMESEDDNTEDIFDILDENDDNIVDRHDYYNDANGNGKFDSGEKLTNPSFEKSELGDETYRTAMILPIANGDSLSLTTANSRLYRYNTYGLSEANGGKSLILIGYKRRITN